MMLKASSKNKQKYITKIKDEKKFLKKNITYVLFVCIHHIQSENKMLVNQTIRTECRIRSHLKDVLVLIKLSYHYDVQCDQVLFNPLF